MLPRVLHIPWTMPSSQPLTPAQQFSPKQIFFPSGPTFKFNIHPNTTRGKLSHFLTLVGGTTSVSTVERNWSPFLCPDQSCISHTHADKSLRALSAIFIDALSTEAGPLSSAQHCSPYATTQTAAGYIISMCKRSAPSHQIKLRWNPVLKERRGVSPSTHGK